MTPMTDDARALARYRYLLRTAPPEAIEQAHQDAFAQLSPAQRQQVLREMSRSLPPREATAAANTEPTPHSLARLATRAEMREPGSLDRLLGRLGPAVGGGSSVGRMVAGGLVGSLAGTLIGSVIGTAIAQHLFAHTPPDVLSALDAGVMPDDATLQQALAASTGSDAAVDEVALDDASLLDDDLGLGDTFDV